MQSRGQFDYWKIEIVLQQKCLVDLSNKGRGNIS